MATRSKDSGGSAADHQRDLYSWLVEQARLVRDGRWQAIDQDNLAKEIEGLAQQQFDQLESAIHGLLTHLLKWDHPALTWPRAIGAVAAPGRGRCARSQPRSRVTPSRGDRALLSQGARRGRQRC